MRRLDREPRHATVLLAIAAAALLLGCAGHSTAPRQAPTAAAAEPDWSALAAARLPLLAPCERPNIEEKLLCGTIEVWENRAAAAGRRIGLEVVVVPARSADPPPDPVFVFEGGPGGAATGRAAGSVWAGDVRRRDIVLVDQRGTGGSHPIQCDLGGGESRRPGELRQMFPPQDVRSCAAELADRADVRLYTSEHHADDIEQVRRRLGYGPLNIRGGSYGTQAMMVFAQRHPQSTRSLFGIGMTSPLRSNMAERGVMAQRTLAGISRLCAAETGCAALVPSLERTMSDLISGLGDGRRVELADPLQPESRLTLDVGRDWLAEMLRLELYFAFTTRALPWAAHRAQAAGDWEPLVQLGIIVESMFRSTLSYGVLLSVQCSEHMGFDVEAARRDGAGTLFGNYRLDQQVQGCAEWPHEKKPPLGVETPRPLDTPALFLSGAWDPVTPPDYAEEARTLFPNSRHLVLEEGQHGPFDLDSSWECVHSIWADFLDSDSPEKLDTTCTETMRRPPFITDGEEFRAYVAETLAPMAK